MQFPREDRETTRSGTKNQRAACDDGESQVDALEMQGAVMINLAWDVEATRPSIPTTTPPIAARKGSSLTLFSLVIPKLASGENLTLI
jgi:hypothetical protein